MKSTAGPGAVPQHHAGLPGAARLPAAAAGGVAGPAWALWQPGATRGAGPRCAAGGKGARTRRGCFVKGMSGQSILCALHREKRRQSVCAGVARSMMHFLLHARLVSCSAEICNHAADQECRLHPYWLSTGAWARCRRARGSSSTPSGMARSGSSAMWRRKRRTCRRSTCGRLSGCARSAMLHDALAFLV